MREGVLVYDHGAALLVDEHVVRRQVGIGDALAGTDGSRLKHIDASCEFLRTPRGCGTATDKLLSLIDDSVGEALETRPTPGAFTRRLAAIREQAAAEEAAKKT